MKIVHVIIAAAYREGFGYQENILPAKHVELGIKTYVVSYNKTYPQGREYINRDGVNVCFLPVNNSLFSKIRYLSLFIYKTNGLYSYLERISPDIVFVHGLQSIDSLIVCKWVKNHPTVKLYVDQHADYYNSPIDRFSIRMYYKYVYGYIAWQLSKYTIKFWGVTPWRVDYMQKVYNIKPDKTDLLVMGGDEKLVKWENKFEVTHQMRNKYHIPNNAFLIVTGGKIDKAKNIHLLIDAIIMLKSMNVHLIVFGSFDEELYLSCKEKLVDNIHYAGWIDSKDVYPYFLSADLVVFPGTHSVLWEQAVSCGVPGVFKDWNGGFSHVDCGGNALFLKDISTEVLFKEIKSLINNRERYNYMKIVAENKARKQFSYIEIARKSIEIDKFSKIN